MRITVDQQKPVHSFSSTYDFPLNMSKLLDSKNIPLQSSLTQHSISQETKYSDKRMIRNRSCTSHEHYTCPQCFKRFSRPSNLKIHSYSHTGERPFVCSVKDCGRSFSVRSNMKRHMRIHGL